MGCYIWQQLATTLLAVPNVTVHPSTASVQITVLLYDGQLLCGFNVAIKGLTVLAYECNKPAEVDVDDKAKTVD